jgi:hypothetical protein
MAMENQPASVPQPYAQPSSVEIFELDRRRHPRYPCEGHAEVFVPHGGLLFRGRILDLSLSGCFIETATINLERGTRVEVYFAARQLQFRVAGHIAALYRKRGAGIAFQNMGPRRARQVDELVKELKEISEQQGARGPEQVPELVTERVTERISGANEKARLIEAGLSFCRKSLLAVS